MFVNFSSALSNLCIIWLVKFWLKNKLFKDPNSSFQNWDFSSSYLFLRCILQLMFPWWLIGKEFTCQCRRHGFNPWSRKIPWRMEWQPTPVFLPGEFHGQRSLAGYSPWGCKRVGYNLANALAFAITPADRNGANNPSGLTWVFGRKGFYTFFP